MTSLDLWKENPQHICYFCANTAARKIQRRTARLTLCIHWYGKKPTTEFRGKNYIGACEKRGFQRSTSDWWMTCTINAKLYWGVLQEQENHLQGKLDSTEEPLSALSCLPLWWIRWRKTSEKSTLADDVRKMMCCCAQGRKTCWSWNWSSGGKPWRREEWKCRGQIQSTCA